MGCLVTVVVQNDLVHGWGLDLKLGYCAQVRFSVLLSQVSLKYVLIGLLKLSNVKQYFVPVCLLLYQTYLLLLYLNSVCLFTPHLVTVNSISEVCESLCISI